MRPDSYEAQLSSEELTQLYEDLRTPGVTLAEIQAKSPLWKKGPKVGQRVALPTLTRLRWRVRSEGLLSSIEETGQMVEAARKKLQSEPALSGTPSETLDLICSFLGQEILQGTICQEDRKERMAQVHILLRRQDQLLAKAKFQRETCKQFLKWYSDERVRKIAGSDDSYESKIQQLGALWFGENFGAC